MTLDRAKTIPWSTARSEVLSVYPQARIVWSHGGRMVLLTQDDNPRHYDEKVSDAWRTAYRRVKERWR